MALPDERYMLLTTFKRDGTPVRTPTWVVPVDGGSFGCWTSSGSGKAKRLRHTARVTVQPCSAMGNPKRGTMPTEATARLVWGDELEVIRARVVAKYGFMTKVSPVLAALQGLVMRRRIPYADRGVVVTPAA